MVVDRSENFLGCYEQRCHLPDGHLEVHLWELEQPSQTALVSAVISFVEL